MSQESLSIEDILCLLDELEPGPGRRGYDILVAYLRRGPDAERYHEIERMAEDAGTDRRLIGWEREAVQTHKIVDRLLAATGWRHPSEVVELEDALDVDYEALLNVCAARLHRGEGDPAQLAQLERKLRLALAEVRRHG